MADDIQVVNRRLDASGNEALTGLARMGADAFGYRADLRIDRHLAELLRLRVSQLNNCTYCLNLHYEAAREAGIPRAKIDTLTAWWETELHSEAEIHCLCGRMIFAIVRGVLGIIFGLIALFAPIATAVVLAIVIGVWAIVDGVFDIVEAIRHRGSSSMALRIVLGAVSILFGILVLAWPGMSLGILVIFVGVWAIIIGILQIMASVRHRAVPNSGWVWGIIGGALAILFGILVLIRPGAGLVSIIWIIGIWAIVWGITLIVLGVQLRKAANTTEASTMPTA
jgi:AhpD family alkylhydroperoxidase